MFNRLELVDREKRGRGGKSVWKIEIPLPNSGEKKTQGLVHYVTILVLTSINEFFRLWVKMCKKIVFVTKNLIMFLIKKTY